MAEPAPQPEPQPAPEPTPAPQPTEAEFTPITSQEQFDTMIKARLARERDKFSDYDDLKKKAGEYDKIQSESQTELEREKTAREAAEKKAADTEAKARETLLRATVVSEAAKRNVHDPNAAFALIDRDLIEFDDDGSPKGIDKAMDSLLEASPWLVNSGGTRPGGADQGARGGGGVKQLTRDDLQNMTPEQIREARQKGQLAGLGVSA